MNSRRIAFVFGAFVAAAVAVQAADVTGKWTAQVPGRGGQTRETTFNLKADGEKLTGTVSGMQGDTEISDGKVKGDEITFSVKVSFQGNDMKMNYKGKLEGEEIKFTRQVEGMERPPAEFTAKRAK
jgi:opacity protein-like surface antigen